MGFLDRIRYEFRKGNSALRQIIIINLAAFLLSTLVAIAGRLMQFDASQALSYFYLPSNLNVLIVRPWTLITNIFMHAGFWHFAMNMLVLFFLGRILEGFISNTKFWTIFIGGAIAGSILYLISYNVFPVFRDVVSASMLLGASGGVTAIVVAAGVFLPYYEVFLFGMFKIQLRWIALIMVFRDIFSLPTSNNLGGLFAHMGGALFGMLFIMNLKGTINLPDFTARRGAVKKMKVSHYDERLMRRKGRLKHKPDQEEIDAILDKINQSGYNSLTQEEKDILIKASE